MLTVKFFLFARIFAKMHRNCVNEPDKFCVCDQFTGKLQRRSSTSNLLKMCNLYFFYHFGDQDKPKAPLRVCLGSLNELPEGFTVIKRKKIGNFLFQYM